MASRLHPLPPPRNSLWDRPGGRGSMAPSRAGWPKPTGPCSAGLRAPFPNHHPAPSGTSGAPRAACGSGEAGSELPSASLCLLQPRVAQGFLVKMVLGQNVPRKLLLGQWCTHHAAGACGIAPEGQHHGAKVSLPSFPWTLCDGVSSLWGHKKLPAPPCPLRPSHRSWDLLSSLRGQLPALVQGTRLCLPSAGHVPHVLQE